MTPEQAYELGYTHGYNGYTFRKLDASVQSYYSQGYEDGCADLGDGYYENNETFEA